MKDNASTPVDADSESTYSSEAGKKNNPSVDVNNLTADQITNKVLELDCKGYSQQDIAEKLGMSQPTVSRYLKRAKESVIESNTNYVNEALHNHNRALMGQDRALRGLWSIVEDPDVMTSHKIRAYSLIINCNSKKSQTTVIARGLSQWRQLEEKLKRDNERNKLSRDEQIMRALEGQTTAATKTRDTESPDPNGNISDFMNDR